MHKILFRLTLFAMLFASSPAQAGEVHFKLEEHQKLVGTYSGDLDQETSVHLVIFQDKNADNYGIMPYFINEEGEITSLEHFSLTNEPSIISYHLNRESSNLTLLVQNGRKKDQLLEIIDLNILNKTVSRSTLQNYEEAYLVIRAKDRSFLIYKEKDGIFNEKNALDIRTIYDSKNNHQENYSFNGVNRDQYRRIFETTPESVNTNEYVENGSIQPSRVYFFNDRLIFDHTSPEGYTTLRINPESSTEMSFMEFEFGDFEKLKEINSYIYESKVFLFLNNKKDLNLRSYNLEDGKLLASVHLQEDLSGHLNSELLEKILKKSSRRGHRLTGTVNEGPENSLVVNIDYVSADYNYHYNWWWHYQFMQQHMMWQNQMMQQHMRMQMNTFGPNPETYAANEFTVKNTESIQLVIDRNFKFQDGREATTLRPNIDKDKYIERFEKNRQLKDVSIAFTKRSGHAIFYSRETNKVHIQTFDL